MREVSRRPSQWCRDRRLDLLRQFIHFEGQRLAQGEHANELVHIVGRRSFVESNPNSGCRQCPQVDLSSCRGCVDLGYPGLLGFHCQRVEKLLVYDAVPETTECGRQHSGQPVHAFRDLFQSFRTVIHRVHAGHHRKEDLCGAHVGSRLLPSDVLLARLQRHAQRLVSSAVPSDADDAAGELSFIPLFRGEECGVGTTVSEGYAEALRIPNGHVGTPFAGRGKHGAG